MSAALASPKTELPATTADASLVVGRFAVDCGRPLPGAGGGLPAFAATDRANGRGGLMALLVRPDAPSGATPPSDSAEGEPGTLLPLAQGAAPGPAGAAAWFMICPAPPGPALSPDGQATIRPWGEGELFALLLRPAALALERLQARKLTHRAIRPNNVFRAEGGPAVLGCAWAAPPAMLQPAAFEPPYSAMCLQAGRGEGSVADDVYALGVLMLALVLGRMPWADLPDEVLLRRKLELGSYAALVGDQRPPPAVAELARAMLADDPEYRPAPGLLVNPMAARARRLAVRPVRRAQRPLQVGEALAWEPRMLALLLARDPATAAKLLRLGVIEHWLRRSLEDGVLAARLEEPQFRHTASGGAAPAGDRLHAMRVIAALDPLAPLCWDGIALWPDALGPALAAAEADPAGEPVRRRLCELIDAQAVADWTAARGVGDPTLVRPTTRMQRTQLTRRDWSGGVPRLRYDLNPTLPCRSPALGGRLAARLGDLLDALEQAAPDRPHGVPPLDHDTVAFIAARSQLRLDGEIAGLAADVPPEHMLPAQLRLLARMQEALRAGRLPNLAAALAEAARPALVIWRSRSRREAKAAALIAVAPTGDLTRMRDLFDDPGALDADGREREYATAQVAAIDAELATLAAGKEGRATRARALGRDIAGVLALGALLAVAVASLVP
jgi:eukaryotic-like serine/threonine-protein kinase